MITVYMKRGESKRWVAVADFYTLEAAMRCRKMYRDQGADAELDVFSRRAQEHVETTK